MGPLTLRMQVVCPRTPLKNPPPLMLSRPKPTRHSQVLHNRVPRASYPFHLSPSLPTLLNRSLHTSLRRNPTTLPLTEHLLTRILT